MSVVCSKRLPLDYRGQVISSPRTLRSKLLEEMDDAGTIDMEEFTDLKRLLEITRDQLRKHFLQRCGKCVGSASDKISPLPRCNKNRSFAVACRLFTSDFDIQSRGGNSGLFYYQSFQSCNLSIVSSSGGNMGNPFQQIATLWTEILPLLSEPARDLSDDDAFELMMYLVGTGDITLFDKLVKDKSGNITSHKPGVQTRIVPVIAGIPFLKARGSNPGPNGSLGATQQQYFAPTPAFAIVLYKLAKMLANDWGATQIVYGGIGAGGNANVTDCHSTGHCVDFYGANTKKGNFDVRQDWWMRPVYDSAGNLHASEGNGWTMDRSEKRNQDLLPAGNVA